MQKILNEASLKAELYSHHMEIEHADAIRAIVEANDREMLNERNKFDSIRYELDARVRDLAAAVEQKDLDRQKMVGDPPALVINHDMYNLIILYPSIYHKYIS